MDLQHYHLVIQDRRIQFFKVLTGVPVTIHLYAVVIAQPGPPELQTDHQTEAVVRQLIPQEAIIQVHQVTPGHEVTITETDNYSVQYQLFV